MNSRLITALIKKDLVLFTRDRFYFLLTILSLVLYVVLYLVMPGTLNETLELGIYAPGVASIEDAFAAERGVAAKVYSTEEELKHAVSRNQYPAGIALPEDLLAKLMAGEKPVITVYFSSRAPEEIKGAVTSLVSQMAFLGGGQENRVQMNTEVLGPDLLGAQIPWRDRLIPMLVILILATEIFSFASLVSTELVQNTVQALLVTPLRLSHLFSAKAILGIGLAFIQVLLFVGVIGGLSREPMALVVGLLLGSILVAGVGFLVASLSRDMMGVTAWGMLATIVFIIPALGALFPGLISGWARVLPSYYLTDAISRVINYGASFNSIGFNLIIMLGWAAAFATIGILSLGRRFK